MTSRGIPKRIALFTGQAASRKDLYRDPDILISYDGERVNWRFSWTRQEDLTELAAVAAGETPLFDKDLEFFT
jgi:hypothetical protein